MKIKTISLITLISVLFILAIPSFALSKGIKWHSYDKGTAIAKEQGKMIFLYFYADTEQNPYLRSEYPYCSKLKESTFKDSAVINYLNDNFVSISINILGSSKEKKLQDSFGVHGVPSMRFLRKDNTQIRTLGGYIDAKNLMKSLPIIKTESYMSFQDYYDRGIAYHKEKDFTQAIHDYTRAIEIKPDFYQAYFNRGCVHHEEKLFTHAIDDYTKAIENKPDFYQAYFNRGDVYYKKKDFTQAIQDFNRVIQAKPASYQAIRKRGLTYARQGNYPLAIQDFNRIIQAKPAFYQAIVERGLTYARQENYPLAIQDLNKTINIKPDFYQAYLWLAKVYVDNHQHEKAIATYSVLIQKDAKFIKHYQKSLKEKGFYSGPIDGANTKSLQSAIEACVNAGKVVM
ncbi:MAG: tetratricopeptide repeat protein [Desulfobacteraceae bacterium]|nr:tetratricopeptide repeat protein [Desulfobacteraceae bacterium]